MERTKTVIAAEQRLESLPVSYPETTRRCRASASAEGAPPYANKKPY